MIGSVRAELLRLRRWPATWVLIGLWLMLNLMFRYVFNYVAYRSGDANEGGQSGAQLLAVMMPDETPVSVVSGLPMFGGAIVLILAALAVGSGYGWGTWKTVFTAGPRRLNALAGTLVALGIVVTGLVLATFAVDLGASVLIATVEGQSWALPGLSEVVEGIGGSLLIALMWTAGGVLLGTVTRGPALAVGLGLMWSLVVENLLRGVAGLLGPVEAVTTVLPGTAAGSMAGALGAAEGVPGVLDAVSGGTAALLLTGYLAIFVLASAWLTARRDLT